MAMPTSASVRAGLSLMPSPTMATITLAGRTGGGGGCGGVGEEGRGRLQANKSIHQFKG